MLRLLRGRSILVSRLSSLASSCSTHVIKQNLKGEILMIMTKVAYTDIGDVIEDVVKLIGDIIDIMD